MKKDTIEANDEETTRLTVERFNSAFNRHDVDAIMSLMTANCVFENTNPPPDGLRIEGEKAVREYWMKFFANNPDAYFEEEELIVTGNRCVVRWIYRKTKDGKPWHLRGVDVFKVENGKVAEKLAYVKG
ncbi:MAG: nuclear transport factor 2 family protein [Saprospiraceae bacterium]|nr:nuclear transport factor 2 family protein [Candidatus Parvibacillus calidus]MBX2938064.1 nuclear transport factor 2 family protein [Saprospiraceae bacterium]HCN38070.1 nuclear transport factor 2 family protein [Bacteroidota bacterium]MBX7178734.1 nuclear transport factor 2 family protein [Saprospiraceae bacterium]MCB0591651.1 nuclear transport factor 2 family protein [Saprospiraceae bacterium]